MGLEPGMKVLDAGCGPGRLTLPLAEAVGPQGEVLAMDVQDGMLARVRAKVQASGLQNVRYLQAGLGEGELPLNYYDRALLVTVLGEIPDQIAALREIHNALKPGGIISVTEVIFDPHFQHRETVLHAAEAAGFREKNLLGKRLAYTISCASRTYQSCEISLVTRTSQSGTAYHRTRSFSPMSRGLRSMFML